MEDVTTNWNTSFVYETMSNEIYNEIQIKYSQTNEGISNALLITRNSSKQFKLRVKKSYNFNLTGSEKLVLFWWHKVLETELNNFTTITTIFTFKKSEKLLTDV